MTYKTSYAIYDTQDRRRYYGAGAVYPAKGADVSEERITELLEGGHIYRVDKAESQDLNKLKVDELKDLAKERGLEGYHDLRKAELVDLLEE